MRLDGNEVFVDAESVTVSSDTDAVGFFAVSEADYCIDLAYGVDRVMSIREDGTFSESFCARSALQEGDDADDSTEGDGSTDDGAEDGSADGVDVEAPDDSGVNTPVNTLAVGDCFLDPTEGVAQNDDGTWEFTNYTVVPCDQPHYGEAYAVVNSTLAEFDQDAIVAEADEACYDSFEAYVGISYDDSVLFADTYYPTAESWMFGDREIACAIAVDTGDAVGSFAGTAE